MGNTQTNESKNDSKISRNSAGKRRSFMKFGSKKSTRDLNVSKNEEFSNILILDEPNLPKKTAEFLVCEKPHISVAVREKNLEKLVVECDVESTANELQQVNENKNNEVTTTTTPEPPINIIPSKIEDCNESLNSTIAQNTVISPADIVTSKPIQPTTTEEKEYKNFSRILESDRDTSIVFDSNKECFVKDRDNCDVRDMKDESFIVSTESWNTVKNLSGRRDSYLDNSKNKSTNGDVIIVREQTTSSSSDSIFTDPLTPIGFAAEINECYCSEENITDSDPEKIKEIYRAALAARNYPRKFVTTKEKLDQLSLTKLDQFDLEGISEDNETMFNFLNKVAPHGTATEGELTDKNIFSISRFRKVDLPEISTKSAEKSLEKSTEPSTPISQIPEQITNTTTTISNQNPISVVPESPGNVLKKVASFTVINDRTPIDISTNKILRPTYVPEKLKISAYEKFEGQMLLNWLTSSIEILTTTLSESDCNLLTLQICTNLLEAGVIKQIPDKHAPILETFKSNFMYQWTHTENPTPIPITPGKLDINWPSTPLYDKDKLMSIKDEKMKEIKTRISECNSFGELKSFLRTVFFEIEETTGKLIETRNKSILMSDLLNTTDVTIYQQDSSPMFSNTKRNLSADFSESNNNENVDTDSTVCSKCNKLLENIPIDDKCDKTTQIESDDELLKDPILIKEEIISTVLPPAPPPPPPPPPPMPFDMVSAPPIPPPPPPPFPSNAPVPPPPPPPPGVQGAGPPPPPPLPGMSGPPPPPPPMGISTPPGFPKPPQLPNLGKSTSNNSMVPPSQLPLPMPMPPPSGGWYQTNILRKEAINPPKPMRPLYWTRVVAPKSDEVDSPDSPNSSTELWQEIDEADLDNLDEFAELFSRHVVLPKVKEEVAKPVKIKAAKVLDSKRSQQVGIFARSLHIDFSEIEHAIYHCDTSVVSLEVLQHIMEMKATTEELSQIKEISETDVPLDTPEQFLLKISHISSSADRIACIVFQADFDEGFVLASRKLETVKRLCEYLLHSEELKKLFSIILKLGNFMNGGNRTRGQADGFGLDILPKLRDVKSKDSKVTLLHFIVKTFIEKQRKSGIPLNEVMLPVPDISDIEKSIHVDFGDSIIHLNSLEKKLIEIKKTTEKVIEQSSEENLQPFKDKMENFMEDAAKRIQKQLKKLDDCKELFIKTMKFYKFMPRKGTLEETTPGQFFEIWAPFSIDFRDIWKKEMIILTNELIKKTKKTVLPTKKSKTINKAKPGSLKERIENLKKK